MRNMKQLLFLLSVAVVTTIAVSSCKKDDPEPMAEEPRARFTPNQDPNNPFSFTFVNESINAETYAWEFGDGNTSTQESPSHTYSAEGDYTVELTATGPGGVHSSTASVSVVDPDKELKKLTGDNSKVWKLSRNVDGMEFPLQVGPADRSQIWWAYGLNDPIGSRPCLMEEEYTFSFDGNFSYDPKGLVFADYGIWHVDLEGSCVDATDPANMVNVDGADISAWGAGDFTFDFDPSEGTLTLNGVGAHVGLPKVGSTGEYNTPQTSVTYKVTMLDTEGDVDKMVLETELTAAGGYWQFFLVSYDDPSQEPDLPGAPPTASFDHSVDGATVTFTNTSVDATSYSWDFGDGNMSSEESPVHMYAADGNYTVTLTAMNENGESTATVNVVISLNSVFSSDVLHGGDSSKIWKLISEAGALAVGPSKGSGEWWASTVDDIDGRACTFDDEYIFTIDGNFIYNTNGDVWAEAYMGVDPAACVSEDMLSDDASAWGSGMHTYELSEAMGDDPAYITVKGTGAFIALPKAYNGGEYQAPPPAADGMVRYEVLSYTNDDAREILVLTIDISENQEGGAYWSFTMVSE